MIAGDISIASGLKWLPPRYRAVILETVLPRWSEYRPSHFDKAIASLAADERILAIKKYGWCRRNYKGLLLEEKPCRTAGREVLPSSQSDLLALSMQQPDHPDIAELVYKLKRTNLQVVLNKFIANGLFPKHRRLFCAVMSHPGLEEESRLHLAKMASEKDLSLLNPFMKEQIDSEATAIKDIFMAEVDSCLARFCAIPKPGSLRLFALLHERSPVENLARNVRSNDWLERYAIACNPSTPMQSLEILAHDGVKFVSRAANASWHRLNA